MRKWLKTLLLFVSLGLASMSTMPAESSFDYSEAYDREIPESLYLMKSFEIRLKDAKLISMYPSIAPIEADGTRISDGYGPRMHPIYHKWSIHRGIDFAANYGTPVVATGDGTVLGIKPWGGYGRQILIDHGNGYRTRYAHLSKILVNKGDRVNQGDTIGKVGSTGLSTGNHLHYEIIYDERSIDPMSILPDTLQLGEYFDYMEKVRNHIQSRSDFLSNILNQTEGEENTEPTRSYQLAQDG